MDRRATMLTRASAEMETEDRIGALQSTGPVRPTVLLRTRHTTKN